MFEESRTETSRCNQGKKTRKEIGQNTLNMIEAKMKKQEDEKRKKEYFDKFGKNAQEPIVKGTEDRLLGIYEINKFENIKDRNSYTYGFTERGGRQLASNINNFTKEELKAIGRNDFISGIKIKELPEEIKENKDYQEGYYKAAEEQIMSILNSYKGKNKHKGK